MKMKRTKMMVRISKNEKIKKYFLCIVDDDDDEDQDEDEEEGKYQKMLFVNSNLFFP
jgi:hypothetical protein